MSVGAYRHLQDGLTPPPDLLMARGVVSDRHGPRDYTLRRALAAGDVAGIALGLAVAALVSKGFGLGDLVWSLATIPLWIIVFRAYGLYDRDAKRVSHSTLDDVPRLLHGVFLSALLLWAILRLTPPGALLFKHVVLAAILALGFVFFLRIATRHAVARALGPERCLLIGEGPVVDVLARKMRAHPEYCVEPVGLITNAPATAARAPIPIVGAHDDDLADVASLLRVERVIVAHENLDGEALADLLHQCRLLGLKASIVPKLFDGLGPSVEIDDVEGIAMLGITPPVLSRSSRALKRGMDIVGAGALLVLTAPLLTAIAIAIRLTSPGPILFRQQRIGKTGKTFELIKFRTMHVGAEALQEQLRAQSRDPDWLLIDDDPRVTRVGRFLRLNSLDELPQLWNVVKGEMSLVGPRPLIASEDDQLEGWRRSRVDLTPGLTGLWQVLGRTRIPFEEMIKLDYLYLTNWSLWTDIRLILRTLPAVAFRRGAN